MENPSDDTLTIAQRRNIIIGRIDAAAKRAGREDCPDLVAVSKVQPDSRVKDMLAAGQTIFGENRVQEAQKRWGDTFQAERKTLELRLIGPLQSNKAEDAAALFDVIETLDREKLAKALLKAADKIGRMPRLYVQVNTGEEPQKAGVTPQALGPFLQRLASEYNLQPEGLMCIPPIGQAAAPHFWLLSKLAQESGITKLSMGMSADYETAVDMGATSLRIGSALFGARKAEL